MVEATCPVHSNIAFVAVKPGSALHTTTSTNAAELEKPIEYRTIITDIVLALLLRICLHVVGRHFGKEIDILIGVELGHFEFRGGFRTLQD